MVWRWYLIFSPHLLISGELCNQIVWQWHCPPITSYINNPISAVTNTLTYPLNCKKILLHFFKFYLLLYHNLFITFCTFKNLFIFILHVYVKGNVFIILIYTLCCVWVCVCLCVCVWVLCCVVICMLLPRFNYLPYHCIFNTCTQCHYMHIFLYNWTYTHTIHIYKHFYTEDIHTYINAFI